MKKLFVALAALAALCSCGGNGDKAVPRRTAYPRVALYDTVMTTATAGGVLFEINAEADTSRTSPNWLDIAYPAYGVTVNMAVNRFDGEEGLRRALANRHQRMSLAFGDIAARSETFTNHAGFECLIAGSPDAGTAPIHILAWRPDGTVVSGAAVFAGSTKPVDSIAPIYSAVYSDLSRLLLSLK